MFCAGIIRARTDKMAGACLPQKVCHSAPVPRAVKANLFNQTGNDTGRLRQSNGQFRNAFEDD